MRSSTFIVEKFNPFHNRIEMLEQTGSCFQTCKGARVFAYRFKSEDIYKFMGEDVSIAEHIKYVLELTRAAIAEFDIPVQINHYIHVGGAKVSPEGKNMEIKYTLHEFEIICDGEYRNYNVYLAVIFSRFFNCAEHMYSAVITAIYKIRQLGFSPMESYLIASNYAAYASYSFSGGGIFDIDKYRALPDKKVLLNYITSINANFSKLCLLTREISNGELRLTNVQNASGQELVNGYYTVLASIRVNSRKVLKINVEKFKRYFGITEPLDGYYSWGDPRSTLSKLLQNPYYENVANTELSDFHLMVFEKKPEAYRTFCNRPVDYGMLDMFEPVDIQEFIKDNSNDIYLNYLTPKKASVASNWRTSSFRRMFKSRTLDITKELNDSKTLPVKLKKTKALAA